MSSDYAEIYKLATDSGLDPEVAKRIAERCTSEPDLAPHAAVREAREVASLCKALGFTTTVAAVFVAAGYSFEQARTAIRNYNQAGRGYDLGLVLMTKRH